MSDTASRTLADALGMLPLPEFLHLLTGEQLRGADCVYCCERLDTATALDLGDQIGVIDGVPNSHWFPRACPTCIGKRARTALHEHGGMCEQCTDNASTCPDRQALRELSLGASR